MVFNLNIRVVGRAFMLSVVSVVIASTSLFAQKFSLGAKAGPLVVWTKYGDKDYGKTIENDPKYGFYAAGIISFPLKNNYSCVIEGGFSQKGRNVKFGNGDDQNRATYYFIDAALLLRKSFKFNLGKNIPADWFINVGPHISYWLGGNGTIGPVGSDGIKYKIKFSDTLDLSNFSTMYMVGANRWLFGADIGVGMEAPITQTQRIMVELRFTWGHTYFGNKDTQNYSWIAFTDNNMQANEKVLSLTLAYMFDIDLQKNKTGKSTKDKEVHRKPVKKRRH